MVNFALYFHNQSTNFTIFSHDRLTIFVIFFQTVGVAASFQIYPCNLLPKFTGFFFMQPLDEFSNFFSHDRLAHFMIFCCDWMTKFTISSPSIDWQISCFIPRDWLSNFTLFFVTDWQTLPFNLVTDDWQNSWFFSHAQLKNLLFFLSMMDRWILRYVAIHQWISHFHFLAFDPQIKNFFSPMTNWQISHPPSHSPNQQILLFFSLCRLTKFKIFSYGRLTYFLGN